MHGLHRYACLHATIRIKTASLDSRMRGIMSNMHTITGEKREARLKIVNNIATRYRAATTILPAGVDLNITQVIHFICLGKA